MNEIFIGGKRVLKVCVVGAGNIGHYLMALIGANDWIKVNVLTSNADGFSDTVSSVNVTTGEVTSGRVDIVSTDPADVIPGSQMIIFAVPSNGYQTWADAVFPYVSDSTILGFMPGSGGPEFVFKKFIDEKHCKIFGTQRVPSGTKVVERGRRVESLGNRKDMKIGAMPRSITEDVCAFFRETMKINAVPLRNYLSVTLTPTNPVIHTSRLYGAFHDYKRGEGGWNERLHMYSNWDELSAKMLLGCDKELHQCCDKLSGMDLSAIVPLREHYEIDTMQGKDDIEKLTKKMRILPFLKDFLPMRKDERGLFVPDTTTRYFHEDFPYGLCILKSFCCICGVATPTMDEILKWYENIMDVSYFNGAAFEGEDLQSLPLPQHMGWKTCRDVISFYDR